MRDNRYWTKATLQNEVSTLATIKKSQALHSSRFAFLPRCPPICIDILFAHNVKLVSWAPNHRTNETGIDREA